MWVQDSPSFHLSTSYSTTAKQEIKKKRKKKITEDI